jgi:hypothetical protein
MYQVYVCRDASLKSFGNNLILIDEYVGPKYRKKKKKGLAAN